MTAVLVVCGVGGLCIANLTPAGLPMETQLLTVLIMFVMALANLFGNNNDAFLCGSCGNDLPTGAVSDRNSLSLNESALERVGGKSRLTDFGSLFQCQADCQNEPLVAIVDIGFVGRFLTKLGKLLFRETNPVWNGHNSSIVIDIILETPPSLPPLPIRSPAASYWPSLWSFGNKSRP